MAQHMREFETGTTRSKNKDKYNKEYNAWRGMRQRCFNSKNPKYYRYGGRGITICSRWNSFDLFLQDVGIAPTGKYSLDRIDNDGNYCPENCHWALNIHQCNNTSRNVIIEFEGRRMNVNQWARFLMINQNTLLHRINALGWTIEKAFTEPVASNGCWAYKNRKTTNEY